MTKPHTEEEKENLREYTRKYRAKYSQTPEYKARAREKMRAWRIANREKALAIERRSYWKNKNKRHERFSEYRRRHKAKVKAEFLQAYGAFCSCCGEREVDFLTVDHVLGGGRKHRLLIGPQNIYKDLKKRGYPKGEYRVLCMNCNWAQRNGKPCPHVKNRIDFDVFERCGP